MFRKNSAARILPGFVVICLTAHVGGTETLTVSPDVHPANNLTLVRSFYQSADNGDSTLTDDRTWEQIQILKTTGARGINTEQNWPGVGTCRVDGKGTFISTNRLDRFLSMCKNRGLKPHVICGTVAPSAKGGENASGWTEIQWAAYAAYAEAYVRYVANQFDGKGFNSVLFEVENEMDAANYGTKPAWFMADDRYTTGSIETYNGYYRLFKIWAGAVDKVAKEQPGKTLHIAGPAATTYTFLYGTMQSVNHRSWMEKLAEDCVQDHVRLDAVTYHEYGASFDATELQPGEQTLGDRSAIIKKKLREVGLSSTRLLVTEWGACEDITSPINCNEVGAAWTAAFLTQVPQTNLEGGVFLLYSDVPDNHNRWTWPAMLHGTHRKAVFNVFDMFNHLPGTTCSFVKSTDWPRNVKVIASADDTSVGIILANYGRWSSSRVAVSSPHDVNLRICNVSGTSAQVREFVIDQDHSNVWTQLIRKSLPAQQRPLEKVQDYTASVTGGTLVLPVRTLSKSAVYMWVVTTAGFKSSIRQ